MITAEHLPGKLNVVADQESRDVKDSSERKLNPQVFKTICSRMGMPETDLFASRLSHQIPAYMAWKPDPHSEAVNALQQKWSHMFPYVFPLLTLNRRDLVRNSYESGILKVSGMDDFWKTMLFYI